MIAAITLKMLDPFGTGKLVLFQVTYDKVGGCRFEHYSSLTRRLGLARVRADGIPALGGLRG